MCQKSSSVPCISTEPPVNFLCQRCCLVTMGRAVLTPLKQQLILAHKAIFMGQLSP